MEIKDWEFASGILKIQFGNNEATASESYPDRKYDKLSRQGFIIKRPD